jgi:hypothetical protein
MTKTPPSTVEVINIEEGDLEKNYYPTNKEFMLDADFIKEKTQKAKKPVKKPDKKPAKKPTRVKEMKRTRILKKK